MGMGDLTNTLVEELLDAHPNLYMSIKHTSHASPNEILDLGAEHDETDTTILSGWGTIFSDPYLDKLLIGSDQFFFVDGLGDENIATYSHTWSIRHALTSTQDSKISHDNVRVVYKNWDP